MHPHSFLQEALSLEDSRSADKIVHMTKLHVSALAPGAVQSEIRAMSVLAEEAGAINMAQGICDTPVPELVLQGVVFYFSAWN